MECSLAAVDTLIEIYRERERRRRRRKPSTP
jgi:hypothetical protein